MRFLLAFIVMGVVGLLCIPSAEADCRVVRQRVVAVQHAAVVTVKETVVVPVTVAAFAAYPVQVPTYSIGYDPHAGEVQELRRSVRELTQALQGLRTGATPAPQPASDLTAKAAQVLTARCATCHTGAAAKGKVQLFTESGVLNPTLDWFAAWAEAESGRMPPAPAQPIPDDEERVLKEKVREVAQLRKQQSLKK